MILAAIIISTIVVPAVVGIVFFYRLSDQVQAFVSFIIFKMCGEMFFMITSFSGINNVNLVHWYTILELIILMVIFMRVFPKFYMLMCPLICIGVFLAFVTPDEFNVAARVLESITMTVASLLVYAKPDQYEGYIIKYGPYADIRIICAGLTLYYLTGVVVFWHMRVGSDILLLVAWSHIVLGAVCNMIYTYGILHAYGVINEKPTIRASDNTY